MGKGRSFTPLRSERQDRESEREGEEGISQKEKKGGVGLLKLGIDFFFNKPFSCIPIPSQAGPIAVQGEHTHKQLGWRSSRMQGCGKPARWWWRPRRGNTRRDVEAQNRGRCFFYVVSELEPLSGGLWLRLVGSVVR